MIKNETMNEDAKSFEKRLVECLAIFVAYSFNPSSGNINIETLRNSAGDLLAHWHEKNNAAP